MKLLLCLLIPLTPLLVFSQVRITAVIPQDTDPEINTFTSGNQKHVVYYDPSVNKRNQLYIFLPGTNGTGFGAAKINQLAAKEGYHVISLMYPDDAALAKYSRTNDPEVYSKGREEIITGKDVSSEYSITRANSIENRIIKLIIYLSKKFPDENWNQFLDADKNITWEKVAIAGHSQGGGHAAFIAKKHKVARVLMFGSPKDYSIFFNAPADWIRWKSRTPVERYFTFVHSEDNVGCIFMHQKQVWDEMGMFKNSSLVNVDTVAAPFMHSRILTSEKFQTVPHTSVVSDVSYESAWRYMLNEKL